MPQLEIRDNEHPIVRGVRQMSGASSETAFSPGLTTSDSRVLATWRTSGCMYENVPLVIEKLAPDGMSKRSRIVALNFLPSAVHPLGYSGDGDRLVAQALRYVSRRRF
jgi:hypothetical protein